MMLYEALEKSMNRDHSEELLKDLAEANKKRKKRHDSPKTPHGSPPHQPPPPPPPSGPSGASGSPGAFGSSQVLPPPPSPLSTNQEGQSRGSTIPSSSKIDASAEYKAWIMTDTRLGLSVSSTPKDLQMDDEMAPDAQAHSSDDEDIGNAHIPKVNLRQDWWKPLEEDRPATLEPSWSISSFDVPVPKNSWASALSTYSPPLEDSLLAHNVSKPLLLGGPPGQVTIESDFFFNKDLEYLRYRSKGSRPALSISKMKAAYYPDVGSEQMVPDQIHTSEGDRRAIRTHMQILSVFRIEVVSMYGYDYMKKIVLRRADLNEHTRHLVIKQRVEDFQLGIESYQTQLNLTKPRWDATGFEYKHEYTVIDSSRAVTFRDRYGVQMIMRFNKIHKFSDGTLHQIDEALDYRVKEFKVNRINPGLNTRFWTRKDVDRSKDFMFAIQKWLKTRRIFRNLESFVGGRGTVRFGNDQLALILGYRDLVQGNTTSNMVYYVKGLNHNLFLIGQFCDTDLEVAFWKSTCFVKDLQGNDLLTGNRGSNFYTISLQETTSSSPLCLMAKASPTQAWLWHRRLSHLNFDYINLLSKKDVVIGLPKLKDVKDQLCSSYEVGKAKRSSFKTKTVPCSKGRLNLLHMDLCGPIRVVSINGKKDGENLDKMKEKGDQCILLGYSTQSKGYHVYKKRARLIVESIHLRYNEIKKMSETSVANDTSGLVPQRQKASDYDNSNPAPQIQHTKDHPLEQVHGNPSKPVQTRRQLATYVEMCMFALTVSTAEPKNIKEAMADSAWINTMQEELHQFDRLQVWELVDKPYGKHIIKIKWLWKNKKDEEQTVICNKAWLVAKGYAQEEGIDFEESFALVAPWKLFGSLSHMMYTSLFLFIRWT
uniref:Retrovirus-related Pol polyprotein from transposon TNT 1-94 n=1 Tax=Tanacetum cinerariifolium TaxID=118510 RepID=A0A699HPC7_TANCI|nr:retrovirus-related Pol polyprotein from transposon TNT 1-94 [Tanacetum cinerariifolium]